MNSALKLSVCVPTYNRLDDLKECLGLLLPQIAAVELGRVELIIVDNASTDDTGSYLKAIRSEYAFVTVYTNPEDLGFDGNTVKCVEYARGEYTALLSDDDRYLPGAVDTILRCISKEQFCLVYLQYYGFFTDCTKPQLIIVPEGSDRSFKHAEDVMGQPGVGHFSGFVYHSRLAKQALRDSLQRRPDMIGSRGRCVFLEIAYRVVRQSSLPSLLVGKHHLASKADNGCGETYVGLPHLTVEACRIFEFLLSEGLIESQRLQKRYNDMLARLPALAIKDTYRMSCQDVQTVIATLDKRFSIFPRYRFLGRPLLWLGCFWPIRLFYRVVHQAYRLYKRLWF